MHEPLDRIRDDGPAPEFSVVLPVFNEQGNLDELHRRLTEVLAPLGTYEILFVDDGSRDRSWETIRAIAAADPHAFGLRFSRNFGHHLALTAGLDAARGRYVVTMDADLQDRPEEIPNLYRKLSEGYDSVFGIRVRKRFPFHKRVTSYLFNAVMRRLAPTPHPIHTNVFRIMNRRFADAFRRFREHDRFITGLFAWQGFRQAGIEVIHGERFSGDTKYDLRRMIRLAANGVVGFSRLPLRIPAAIGVITGAASLIGTGALLARFLAGRAPSGWALTLLAVLWLSTLQFLALGVLAAYVDRIHAQVQGRPLYLVAETTGRRAGDPGESHDAGPV